MVSRRKIFIAIFSVAFLVSMYNIAIFSYHHFNFDIKSVTSLSNRMKYHEWFELYSNISNPNIEPNYLNPPLKPYCRNEVLVRDFDKDPVIISITPQTTQLYFIGWFMKSHENQARINCEVNCIFHRHVNKENIKQTDGFFTFLENKKFPTECKHQKNIFFGQEAWVKFDGFDIVGSTFPISDIYSSYSGYDFIHKDPYPKTEKALASAFISNCYQVSSDRNRIIEELFKSGIEIDSFGNCHKNKEIPEDVKKIADRNTQKMEIIKRYKFHLAFENSNKDGYISEKYWQSLYTGTVPIYLGAPDIKKYEPLPGSMINVHDYPNVQEMVKDIKRIASNETLYNKMLEWKKIGPSDEFMARLDQSCPNIYCSFCIKTADTFVKPIEFTDENFTIIFIRERTKFRYRTVQLASKTLNELKEKLLIAFEGYIPIWKFCHTSSLRVARGIQTNPPALRIFRIIKSGLNYHDSFEGYSIDSDEKVALLSSGSRLEVIFV